MKKSKQRKTRRRLTATQINAEATVSPWLRRHGTFEREAFTDRDNEEGLQDNSRMRRVSPVKVLERMATTRGREPKPFLDRYHMEAANRLHGLIEASQGGMSHEILERVQSSRGDGYVEKKAIAAIELEAVYKGLPPDATIYLRKVFGPWADFPLSAWFPDKGKRRQRAKEKENIRLALEELARYFGLLT